MRRSECFKRVARRAAAVAVLCLAVAAGAASAQGAFRFTGPGAVRVMVLEGGIGGEPTVMTLTQAGDSIWGEYRQKGWTGAARVEGNVKDSLRATLNEYEDGMLMGSFDLYIGEYDGEEFIGGECVAGHTSQAVLFHVKSVSALPRGKSSVRFAPPAVSGGAGEAPAGGADVVTDVAEVMPEFPGGAAAMFKYLSQKLRYPTVSRENKVQGRVIVQFVVGRDGAVRDVAVKLGVDPWLDKEAVRVVSSMPRWKPGTQKGRPVSVRCTLPVSFRL